MTSLPGKNTAGRVVFVDGPFVVIDVPCASGLAIFEKHDDYPVRSDDKLTGDFSERGAQQLRSDRRGSELKATCKSSTAICVKFWSS